MPVYKLDRNQFKSHTMAEAAVHKVYYQKMTWQERLSVASYLNSVAFNYNPESPPRLDRTRFSAKSLKQ